jgi:hypothetical protein
MRVNRWSFVFICLNQALWPDAQAQHRFGKGSPKRKKGSDHSLVHFDARGNEPSYGRTPFQSPATVPGPRAQSRLGRMTEAQVRQIEDALLEWLEIERAC